MAGASRDWEAYVRAAGRAGSGSGVYNPGMASRPDFADPGSPDFHPDAAAFEAAVYASRGADETARLAYADWVEERAEADFAAWLRTPNPKIYATSSLVRHWAKTLREAYQAESGWLKDIEEAGRKAARVREEAILKALLGG